MRSSSPVLSPKDFPPHRNGPVLPRVDITYPRLTLFRTSPLTLIPFPPYLVTKSAAYAGRTKLAAAASVALRQQQPLVAGARLNVRPNFTNRCCKLVNKHLYCLLLSILSLLCKLDQRRGGFRPEYGGGASFIARG